MSQVEPLPPREAGAVEEAAWTILGGLVARHGPRELRVREDRTDGGDLLQLVDAEAPLLTLCRRTRRLQGKAGEPLDFLGRFASARRLPQLLAEIEPLAGLPEGADGLDPRRRTLAVAAQLVARTRGPIGWLELRPVPGAGAVSVFAATLQALAGQVAPGFHAEPGEYLALRIVTPWGPDPRGPIGFLRPDGTLLARLGRPGVFDLWSAGEDVRDAVAHAASALSLATS